MGEKSVTFEMEQKNVTKKDPLRFGDFLLAEITTSNISQSDLAKKLGQNRTELGRYVRIGRWSNETKQFINHNRKLISNTAIIKAARENKDEAMALRYLKGVVKSKQAPSESACKNSQPDPTPIPSPHMVLSLQEENRLLSDEVSRLNEKLNQLVNRLDEGNGPSGHNEESDNGDKELNFTAKFHRFFRFLNILKFSAISCVFWIFLVPVTAKFVEQCLFSFSFDKVEYLSFLSVPHLSLILAATFDLLVFSLINGSVKFQRIGLLLICLNCSGAYFISYKNAEIDSHEILQERISKVQNEISTLESKVAKNKAKYLSQKWPGFSNPELCELKKKSCGLPYTSKSKEFLQEYLASKALWNTKRENLKEIYNNPVSKQDPTDIYWHVGYYILIWMLLLVTLSFRKSSCCQK